jgi:hypothetical protein
MKFARYLFAIAGIYGLISLVPMYFLESQIGKDSPPAITHVEYFYGFIGVAVAWQILFLIVARDPHRLRPIIPAAIVEKFSFGIACWVLFFQNRLPSMVLGFACIDLLLGTLFAAAWWVLALDNKSRSKL